MIYLLRSIDCIQLRKNASLLFVFSMICGCNEFHKPITISPKAELAKSHKSISIGRATIHIPDGWKLNSDLRDKSGLGASIELFLFDGKRKAGSILFISQEAPPDWVKRADTKTISTAKYDNVLFWVESTQSPSGDDTPGSYRIRAFIVTPDTSWELHVAFLRPVRPDILTTLEYIDALEFDKGKLEK